MHSVLHFIANLHSAEGLKALVQSGGLFTIGTIVFVETGLLLGFFLPGDSLLVTAGIFAASDGSGGAPLLNLKVLLVVLSFLAVAGDQLGYYLGRRAGLLIFSKEDSLFFKRKHFTAAHAFYEKHGARAVIGARFVPIFRTFVPFSAGVAQMSYFRFLRIDIFVGVLWICSMLMIGYFLGLSPLANQLHKVILVVIFVSLLPVIISAAKRYFRRAPEKQIA